jgi:hypothetical protein
MTPVIKLNTQDKETTPEMPEKLRILFEERKKAKREPLTPEKVRKTPGLENLSDQEALEAIESIKRLVAILFETACQNQSICIDNQHVVNLNQQNKAA